MPANCQRSRAASSEVLREFAATILSSEQFSSENTDQNIKGLIPAEHRQMIQGLLDETSLGLKVLCSLDASDTSEMSKKVILQQKCYLEITVYGPFELFDDIGSWFQDYNIYLQDPRKVERQDVKYCNPHRLSVQDIGSCLLVSEYIMSNSKLVGLEQLSDRPELLDILSSHMDLEETPQPAALKTTLKK